ncbi:T9SS type A sorting domain-containing protein [Larkinella bovis]|uniref:T9SS type A sorting domain-containing protein n=1 Tax=Larkinella bovis TaxID=683041 RepID=A0ABW0IKH7_9BACT
MNKTLRLYWLLLVVFSGNIGIAAAQTITTGALSASSLCAGAAITVPFTTSGTFAAGNSFKVQLAPATGPYTDIGTGTTSPINATIPSGLSGTGYRVRVVSSNPVVNGSVSATSLVITARPSVPLTGTAPIYCQDATTAPLSATAGAGATLNWYTTPSSGTALPAAPAPSSSVPGTTKYYVSQKTASGCESERAEITVVVTAPPAAPGTSPVTFCQNAPASPLTATPVNGATLNWYGTSATGGTASATAPTPPTSTTGTTTYYVSQSINGCESPRASLVVTVRSIPAAPTTTTPSAYCQDGPANALVATASSGGTLNWYGTNATGGTASATATVPTTTSVGATSYYVSQTVNGCEGPRTAIVVTVTPKPAAPTVTASFSYCQGATASQLTAIVGSGGTANWYGTNPTGGTATAVGPTPSTTSPGTSTYYVSQTIGTCESSRASITVTVSATPSAPGVTSLSVCQNLPATALTASPSNGGQLNWYGTSATGGTASATAPTPPTSTTGITTYYVSQSINGCESARASLAVTVKPQPTAPTVGTSLTYCEGMTSLPLTATVSSGGSLNWYGTNATGGTGSSTAPLPATDADGTFNYYVSQTINGCESARASLPVVIKPRPALPTVQDIRYCQAETAVPLSATAEAGGTLKWYATAISTPALTAAPIPDTKAVTESTFYVSQTGANGCESNRAPIKVQIFAIPSSPTVPSLPDVCQNTSSPVTLQATGEKLKWYTAQTGGTASEAAPVQNTNTAGTFTYFVTQTVNQCESPRIAAKIVIKPQPVAPTATSKEVCQDAPVETLSATGENLKWFDINNNGLGSAPTPGTNVDQEITYTYKTTQTVNGCESDKLTITYKVKVTPKPTVVTPVTYCQNAVAKPLEATGQDLTWINPYGATSKTAPIPPTTNISTKPEGDSYFVTQKGSNGCESRKAEIRLIINAPPTAKIEGNATVNLGKTVPVTISFTSVPPFSYTISDGTSGTSETLQKEIQLLPTKKTTIYQITNITNSCGAGTPVGTFTVNAIVPTVTTSPLSVTTLCVGTPIQVPFTTAGEFTPGNSFRVEIATVADTAFANKIEIAAGAQQSPITAPIPTTVAQGLYRVRVTATNPQVPVPGSSSSTILNIRALPTVTLTGTKDIYDNESAPLSFAFTGDGPWTFEYAEGSKISKLTTSSNPHLVSVTPVSSTTYTASSVTNGCGVGTATGTAIIRVLPVLGLEPDPLLTAVKVFPVPAENIVTVDIDLPLQKAPAQLQLTDQSGRVTRQLTTRQRQTTLDLSQQTAGYYFLQIQIGDRKTVRKIMKR